MASPSIVEVRCIPTPDGTLRVEMTQAFIDKVRQQFGLLPDQPLDDDHVRLYVWGAVNAAVDRAEREMDDDARSAGGVPRAGHREDGTRG